MYARRYLRNQIVDKDFRKKSLPSYPLGAKIIPFDSDFYTALTRSSVQLVTGPIHSVHEKGIDTDEDTRPADIITCATSFEASEFLVPITVQGIGGCSLNKDWQTGAEAFMGLAIRGYPDLFMIAGPNSFSPAGSNSKLKEVQISCIMQ